MEEMGGIKMLNGDSQTKLWQKTSLTVENKGYDLSTLTEDDLKDKSKGNVIAKGLIIGNQRLGYRQWRINFL